MKHQNQNSKEPKRDYKNISIGRASKDELKEFADAYIETATMIGFSRQEAIKQLQSQGVFISKL